MFPNNDEQNPYSSAYDEPVPQPLQPTGTVRPTVVSAGDVLNHAWDVFKPHLGTLVGAFILMGIIGWLHGMLNLAIQFGIEGIQPQQQQFPFGPGGANFNIQTTTPLGMALNLIAQAVQIFFSIGFIRMNLSTGRGETPEFGQLFSGGPWFWRVVGFLILYYIALALGFVLLIIPMFIMLFMWWPAKTIIIDNQAGVIDSFKLAAQITKGNWGTSFTLLLAAFGIMILGFLALCVGIVVAVPFIYVMWASAYLMMSGQVGRYEETDQGPMDYGFDQI